VTAARGPVIVNGERDMKVAIVHYWLVSMRGGEKVLESLCELFPTADIFTHVYDPAAVSPAIHRHSVRLTLIGRLPFAKRLYKLYLPLMPMALEQLDLRSYDLVISSESGPAKGVLTRADALHLCYCHTPMRYIWNMYLDYKQSVSPLLRPVIVWLAGSLRLWDQHSAARVDLFLANSSNVKRQIKKYYGRDAIVVHPPVDVDGFTATDEDAGDFYLSVGQLVRYKRIDLAIEACNRLNRRLIIIGEGPEYRNLRKLAGPSITFLGKQDFASLRWHYARCRALLFPGEEDFGIVPVEAMAAGRPVIALRRGGALETVIAGRTGLFFEKQNVESLERALLDFEGVESLFDPAIIMQHARQFSRSEFKRRMGKILAEASMHSGETPVQLPFHPVLSADIPAAGAVAPAAAISGD
jgi:glycosyltransferase involved in cell wall biosynthesis